MKTKVNLITFGLLLITQLSVRADSGKINRPYGRAEAIIQNGKGTSNFNAFRKNNRIEFNWTLDAGNAGTQFMIERSSDAKNFSTVISVAGSKFYNGAIDFYEIDNAPQEGNSYYRLKTVTPSGEVSYSDINYLYVGNPNQEKVGLLEVATQSGNEANSKMNSDQLVNKPVLLILRSGNGQEFNSKCIITQISGVKISVEPMDQTIPTGNYLIVGTSKNAILNKMASVK